MSVLVAVPAYEAITTETVKALWELDGAGHDLMFDSVKRYDCALARIKMCEKALEYGAEWLLMVDSDTVPPRSALADMLEHDVDVCLGYYQWRNRAPGETCLWKLGSWCSDSRYTAAELHALAQAGTTAVRVQGGGMGCALIRTSILARLPRPWFRWIVRPDGTETGEDVFFCDLLRTHGIAIFADTRAACGHAYGTLHEI